MTAAQAARYAIYFAPADGTALAVFAAKWFAGHCWDGWQQPDRGRMEELLQSPRHYGFHATLKPPFVLASGTSAAELTDAVVEFAALRAPFEAPPLGPRRLGRFLALCPCGPAPALAALAGDCVRAFDRFRAPPSASELARRRRAGLNVRQETLLRQWGYPYVLDEFRFHMTLTGPAGDDEGARILDRLVAAAAPLADLPLQVDAVCLFHQPAPDAPFALSRRFAFGGA